VFLYPVSMAMRAVMQANVRCSEATERLLRLPTDTTLWQLFEKEAEALIRGLPNDAIVLDLGGGRRCVYARAVEPPRRVKLIAVDVSPEELALNHDVAEKHVADVAAGIPMPDASVDVIVSRALLEHVDGVPAAIRHMARVLRPGGVTLHFVPCRYSLFGTAARLLPFRQLVRLTHAVIPQTREVVGFPVHYDHCYPQALEREFRAAGFSDVQLRTTWACPGYFSAIYPLFLCYAIYEQVVRRLRLRRLAAYTVVRAVR
jgi:ubiquinone/menaquinone biosynthesis C-methylase UbiE